MKKTIISMALLVMFGAPVAVAQSGSDSSSEGTVGMTFNGGFPPDAPVGHRQPNRSDTPPEKNLANPKDSISRENAKLDKKIKSICRGC